MSYQEQLKDWALVRKLRRERNIPELGPDVNLYLTSYIRAYCSKKENKMNEVINPETGITVDQDAYNAPVLDLDALVAAGIVTDVTITEGRDGSDETVVHVVPAGTDQPVAVN